MQKYNFVQAGRVANFQAQMWIYRARPDESLALLYSA